MAILTTKEMAESVGLDFTMAPLYVLINDNGKLVKAADNEQDIRDFIQYILDNLKAAKS